MPHFLSPGQRALLQQLLQMRQHELDRRVAQHQAGGSRSEAAREVLQQDGDDAPQRDADREIDLARADRDIEELGAVSQALARVHDAGFGYVHRLRPDDPVRAPETRTLGGALRGLRRRARAPKRRGYAALVDLTFSRHACSSGSV